MLSWFGFGKKEKQPSIEETNKEAITTAEAEQEAVDLTENTPEQVVEAAVEKTTGQVVTTDVGDEVKPVENVSVEIIESVIEPVVEEVQVAAEQAVKTELTPEANLLAEMEAAEQIAPITEDIVTKNTVDEVSPELKVTAAVIPEEVIPETLSKITPEPEAVTQEVFPSVDAEPVEELVEDAEKVKAKSKPGFFARLKQGLSKTRQSLGGGLVDLFRGKQIDDDLFEELETHLLMADVGVETTMKIIDSLTKSASRKQLKDASALYDLLKIELKKTIEGVSQPLVIPEGDGPFVMLMVGVNGVGKTTTIGKLAKQFQAEGKSVMLAAGDTFRAAAVEQLQVWGERNDIPVIAQHTGADSASVIFDAISAAKARNVDVIIADTAGRLQNKAHLMEELKKVVRVMKKLDVNAPHEVMLTLDAGTGQNALSQTKLFDEAVGLTGLTLTKLDGTAKGGVVFAIADKHNIPIRYLGVGEGIDDLRPFNADDFIDAIFTN